jgi:copper transport outer membrane protein MctB
LFDLRYHVASLAAVFLALIIGILVGVGIASQTSVSESDRKLLEEQNARLERSLDNAHSDADRLRQQQRVGTDFIDRSYDTVMNGRLRGVHVALLFVGPVDSDLQTRVTATLQDASGPGLARYRALQLPVEPERIRSALPPESADLALDDIGRKLGREFIAGGDTPFWDALAPVLVVQAEGGFVREADAVVVAATAGIDDQPTARFLSGLYAGLAGRSAPVVGVERADEQPSRIPVFRSSHLSSVDSVDMKVGRVALAVLLAGGDEGHYGVKPTADDVVPPIEPLQLAPLPGG